MPKIKARTYKLYSVNRYACTNVARDISTVSSNYSKWCRRRLFRTRNASHFERERGSHILPAKRLLNERTHDTNNVCNRVKVL